MKATIIQALAEIQRIYPPPPPVSPARTLVGVLAGTLAIGLLFYALERLFPEQSGQPAHRPGMRVDGIYWFFDFFVAKKIVGAAVLAVVVALVALKTPRLSFVSSQPLWLQAIEALLVADFCGYWSHRMMHRIPFLWRLHKVHHSSERIDWLASARVHPLETVWNRMVSIAPLFLLGFSPKITAVLGPLIGFYPIFIHCNVRWGYGRFGYLIASPAFHRWHHSSDREAMNRNFSGLLPVFDLFFGTAHFPKHGKPVRFGLPGEDIPAGFWRQLWWPFKRA